MNTVLKRDLTQFDLTKKTLNNLSQYDITPTAKLVLLYLTDCYNPKHADVFPKQKTMAFKLGISERSVMRAVQELFKAGLILIECKHTSRYILMPNLTSQSFQNEILSHKEDKNSDNLSPTCIEQITRTKKEQTVKGGNVYKGDDVILYEYAKTKAKKSVDAYIRKLKETGSAENIIKEYKKKTQSYPYTVKQTELLREKREIEKQERISYEASEAWLKFGLMHGIKK